MPKPTDNPAPDHIPNAGKQMPVPPVPLKEGRNQRLEAFHWPESLTRTTWYQVHAMAPLHTLASMYSTADFERYCKASDEDMARIEATMRQHGVEWRGEE